MTTGTQQITRELRTRRKALLNAYDDEDLHQLRVNIRRVRALLKHQPDKNAKRLRKAFASLAVSTNAARDWDTFSIWTAQNLPYLQWRELQPLVAEYRGRARGRVAGMLESMDWQIALEQWEKLLTELESRSAGPRENKLVQDEREAAEHALQVGRRALAWDDETSWHRFRIAIKNLRYTIDHIDVTGATRRRQVEATQELCKRLQSELGDWHDTVVHRGLLQQLAEDATVTESPQMTESLDALGSVIGTRGADKLLCVREILDHQAWLLTAAGDPGAEGSGKDGD